MVAGTEQHIWALCRDYRARRAEEEWEWASRIRTGLIARQGEPPKETYLIKKRKVPLQDAIMPEAMSEDQWDLALPELLDQWEEEVAAEDVHNPETGKNLSRPSSAKPG